MNKIKKFDKQLEKIRKEATKLYNEKQDTVVCSYCGGLIPKNEAGCIYDIEKQQLLFHHEECFNKYEKYGTLEDLLESKGE